MGRVEHARLLASHRLRESESKRGSESKRRKRHSRAETRAGAGLQQRGLCPPARLPWRPALHGRHGPSGPRVVACRPTESLMNQKRGRQVGFASTSRKSQAPRLAREGSERRRGRRGHEPYECERRPRSNRQGREMSRLLGPAHLAVVQIAAVRLDPNTYSRNAYARTTRRQKRACTHTTRTRAHACTHTYKWTPARTHANGRTQAHSHRAACQPPPPPMP